MTTKKTTKRKIKTPGVYLDEKRNTYYIKYKGTTVRGFNSVAEANKHRSMLVLQNNSNVSYINFESVCLDFTKYLYTKYKREEITYGTYDKREKVITDFIIPYFSKQKIIYMDKFDEMTMRKFSEFVFNTNYSSSHKNYIQSSLKKIFSHSKMFFKNSNNPTYILESFKQTREEQENEVVMKEQVWSYAEFESFIKNVKTREDKYIFMYIILFFTGLRKGEASALRWKHLNGNILTVKDSITRKTEKRTYEVKSVKNRSSDRNLVIADNLRDMLLKHKENMKKVYGFNDDWFIFGSYNPISSTHLEDLKNKTCSESNIKQIRIHDFRHSFASNIISNNINLIAAVSKYLGHKNISVTLKTYSHFIPTENNDLLNILNISSQNVLTSISI